LKVVVFGANGRTGRAVLLTLAVAGHQVTGFARDPQKVPKYKGVTPMAGDALRPADVAAAVAGHDAVVVCLGDSTNPIALMLGARRSTSPDICEVGTANVVAAMQAASVRRLLCVTAYGVGETRQRLTAVFRAWFLVLRLGAQMADKDRQEQVIRASGLDWTIVQPVGLTDGAHTGHWLASAAGDRRKRTISRVDLAAFIVDTVTAASARHLREAVVVSGLTILQALPDHARR
jgi:uncharacterized protein YbjT (DUF2867 family)